MIDGKSTAAEYISGYLTGHSAGTVDAPRDPDRPGRSAYNAGYDAGYEDAICGEFAEYSKEDLQAAENGLFF